MFIKPALMMVSVVIFDKAHGLIHSGLKPGVKALRKLKFAENSGDLKRDPRMG